MSGRATYRDANRLLLRKAQNATCKTRSAERHSEDVRCALYVSAPRSSIISLFVVLGASVVLAMGACAPTRASAPSPSANSSLTAPTSTPRATDTAVAATPTATTVPPTLTATTVVSPTATPTAQSTALSPEVSAAAASFRALISTPGRLNESQTYQAQQALERAASAFVASVGAGNQQRRQQFAQMLSPNGQARATVLGANLDDNGKPDLIVAVPVPGLQPVVLPDGQPTGVALLPGSGTNGPPDTITNVIGIRDFAGGDHPYIIVTRTSQGASATNTEILILRWDGHRAMALFDQSISDWAGPATWKIQPDGAIELTCPAFGVYDHKLLPHPRQVRIYRWSGSAFALASRRTDPPKTRREMMNLAEADFFTGDWTDATNHYQAVVDDASLADEPGILVDWRNLARLRLGEIAALSGKQSDAEKWLSEAEKAGPPLGDLAKAFLAAERSGGPVAGFAAIQRSDLPGLFDRSQMGDLGFPVGLGPLASLGQGVAFSLAHAPDSTQLSAARLESELARAGLTAKDVTVADLDGDGKPEFAMILPFGNREQTVWLFVRTGTSWLPIATIQAPRGLDGLAALPDHRMGIRVVGPPGAQPSTTLLTWDGSHVTLGSSPTSSFVPVPVNFVSASNACATSEDIGVRQLGGQ
jgi:hypothetical protein